MKIREDERKKERKSESRQLEVEVGEKRKWEGGSGRRREEALELEWRRESVGGRRGKKEGRGVFWG
jgi:hypothetical protein